jgi:predicted dehydrogenase
MLSSYSNCLLKATKNEQIIVSVFLSLKTALKLAKFMMKPIKTGLSSYGMSSIVFHGPLLKSNPAFTITKIVERHHQNSRKAFPDADIVRDFKDLCKDPEIELIIVTTPDALHYSFAKTALEAGKNVVVEKPFTQTYEEASELIEIAEKKKLLLSVFQNRRWDGDFLTVKDVIKKNMLGRLVDYESHFDRYRNYIQKGTWKESATSGADILYNLGSHMIDQALVLFGQPEAVYADLRVLRDNGDVFDSFDVLLRYHSLKVMTRGSYLVREPGPRYILHGTHGSFLKWGIDPQEQDLKDGYMPTFDGWGEEDPGQWGLLNTDTNDLHFEGNIETRAGNYPAYYENIHHCLRNDARLEVTAEQAASVIKIIEAARKSFEDKKEILIK